MKKLLVLLLVVFSVSCHKAHETENRDFEAISPLDLKFDLVFPQPLWEMIMKGAPQGFNTSRSAYEIFETLPIQIKVITNHPPVLNGKNYQFEFKDFGGEIDWNSYLNRTDNGSLTVNFEFPKVSESDFKVFFLSWTKSFTKDDEVWGNGCNTILDVTSFFKNTVFKKGMLLHTKDLRYFYMTTGRFYFAFYGKDKINLAQVTFTDSGLKAQLKNKLCENAL